MAILPYIHAMFILLCRFLIARRATFFAFFALAAVPAAADDLWGLVGGMRSEEPETHSYAWALSYDHTISERLYASFSWLNEGHVPVHHRDGHALQLWARADTGHPRLTLAAGIGPYRYFDTTTGTNGQNHANEHGWGTIYSLAAIWRSTGPWLYQLRINRIDTEDSIDTTAVVAGIGYRLQPWTGSGAGANGGAAKRNQVTLFLGQTIVNSLESESSEAVGIEWRRSFGPILRGSLAWIDEGDARLIRRNGAVAQLWLEPSFSGNRFTLGAGAGAYLAIDEYREGPEHMLSGIVTVTTSYYIGADWLARFSWNRIVTDYHRDTDIFLLGIGRQF